MDESDSDSEEFSKSVLGTKEHWEAVFARDMKIYKETKDVGEIWFGNDSVKRVVSWMLSESSLISLNSSILDIGCGNGIMLVELAKNGFCHLCGIDYIDNAIELAKVISTEENVCIQYESANILDLSQLGKDSCLHHQYDVCLDKGTYDAISLNPVEPVLQRARYWNSIRQFCKQTGILIITSCNWTQDELMEHSGLDFTLLHRIPTPMIQFGGKVGSRETVLVLQRI